MSDLAALPDGSLISLERSFALSALGLFENRIYELNFTSATNVAALGSINSGGFTPVAKSPLWVGQIGQNMEGLTVGPRLAWSRWSLIGIIDDGDPASENNLVAFAVSSDICYADFNQDGGIDGADVEAFLTAWSDGAPESEINDDGGIDGADVAAFFEAWEAGGCG